MRRITIDEVRAACEKTGYRLQPGVTLDKERKCGCPAGILAMVQTGTHCTHAINATRLLRLDMTYGAGLVDGFDGQVERFQSDRGKLGYADGSAIRKALLTT